MFRTRFRMNRELFLRIVNALGQWSPYFTYRADCSGRIGLSPLQKCTAAMRMLAYGTPADALDEYLKIGKSTALQRLDTFAQGVIRVFGGEYLRRPTREDVERILHVNESLPGMIGSIDCMHWRWELCPLAWRGQFTRGDYGVPTMVLEAVASQDLHIWHAFFGIAGLNNDLNVLNQSPLFFDALKGEAPRVQFSVNGNEYTTGYYLADGIYPEWAAFMKTIPLPQIEKHKLFAKHQEGARKDVERAFGVLQSRFTIVRRPARLWKRKSVGRIMLACVILHNMIVEDEKEQYRCHGALRHRFVAYDVFVGIIFFMSVSSPPSSDYYDEPRIDPGRYVCPRPPQVARGPRGEIWAESSIVARVSSTAVRGETFGVGRGARILIGSCFIGCFHCVGGCRSITGLAKTLIGRAETFVGCGAALLIGGCPVVRCLDSDAGCRSVAGLVETVIGRAVGCGAPGILIGSCAVVGVDRN
ncbi:uncharacterized protein LOC104584118 [Brachypodium distachyon]|uniref:uncharacterized protein LOC104584118 n=1 Tax=Brachypodium distachyon TaxID=15368 RepID=UPI00052FFE21|nr:uncharacterized protein LOC104584118 [Brachypodium distachyon]|eukprot:XP_010236560.1 uncharacterized protein LOC104584118 [Brachypodium distachyon]